MNTKLKQVLLFVLLLVPILSFAMPVHAIDYDNIKVEIGSDSQIIVKNANGIQSTDTKKQTAAMEKKYNKYFTVIAFITAIATITMIGIFIKHCVKFSALGTEHWMVRRNCMIGMLWSGVATALLGSATFVLAIFYNAFTF